MSLPDTGAQMTVVGMKLMYAFGIKRSELIPSSRGVKAANKSKLGLLGGALVEFSGREELRWACENFQAGLLCGP